MINLFINHYEDKNNEREAELRRCLSENLKNKLIDKVYLLMDYKVNFSSSVQFFDYYVGEQGKIKCIWLQNRPTFKNFFNIIGHNSKDEDINIIANSDIYFNETLELVKNIGENDAYCLSRWEHMQDGTLHQVQVHSDSQDAWIIKGKPKQVEDCDFTMGKYGCDNRIAYLLQQSGYNVTNPSLSIQSIHLHLTNIRNYSAERTLENTVQPPYLLVPLCKI